MKWDHSLIDTLEWGNQISHKEDKIKIADLIASKVENGQVIGVGSRSEERRVGKECRSRESQ